MHECNAMQLLETKEKRKHKNQRTKNNSHKGKTMKHKDHEKKKKRQIRNTESHQLLDEESQTYFYQEVW